MTTQRLEVLREPRLNLSVEQITAAVEARLQSVSMQAVSDALAALGRAGLARQIEPAGRAALFEARVADNHHHVLCRRCSNIADVDCAAPCLAPSLATNRFGVDESEITFWGICADCRSPVSHSRTTQTKEPDHA